MIYKSNIHFKDYTITEDEYDFLYDLVRANNIKSVLEFGLGASTYCFLENGCAITTFETSKHFVKSEFPDLKNMKECEIIYYDPIRFDELTILSKKFDLSFIDGPRGTKSLSRLKSCLYAIQHSNHVLLHDFKRQGEKETFSHIMTLFPEWKMLVFETRRHIGYLYNSKETIPMENSKQKTVGNQILPYL